QTAGFLRSTEEGVQTWIEQAIAADLFVTRGSSFAAAAAAQPMEESLIGRLARLDGVDAVLGVRFHMLDYRNQMVFLLALDTDAFSTQGRPSGERALARNLGQYPRLREGGTALVSEN